MSHARIDPRAHQSWWDGISDRLAARRRQFPSPPPAAPEPPPMQAVATPGFVAEQIGRALFTSILHARIGAALYTLCAALGIPDEQIREILRSRP